MNLRSWAFQRILAHLLSPVALDGDLYHKIIRLLRAPQHTHIPSTVVGAIREVSLVEAARLERQQYDLAEQASV
ncbi:MAG: hypothetical protein IPG17_29310 [Sandaracinaceae bacterium]|nr:hypothetical protein [Sandaracinaceae bacterium]